MNVFEQSVFEGLTKAEQKQLSEKSHLVNFDKGDLLYEQGQTTMSLIYLVAGQIKLCCSAPQGRECVLHIIRPQTIIDVGVLFYTKGLPYSAIALTKGEHCSIERATFLAVMLGNNTFCERMMNCMAARQRLLINKLAGSQGKISVTCRVASWLLHRSKMDDRDDLYFDMTRELMARLLGITRESLSRELSRLAALGYIRVDRRAVHLIDKEALQKLAAM